MAMLASKTPYSAPAMGGSAPSQPPAQYNSSSSSYRTHATPARTEHAFFASPTESEFSEIYDAPDSVRHWNEEKVGDWLKSINCSQYVELFKRNHINGENLMEMDQTHLKEMGIKKVGDRVRIGSQAKQLRNKEYKKASKRTSNRQSLAMLDHATYTPPSSGSPRPLNSSRSNLNSSRGNKRISAQFTGSLASADLNYASAMGYGSKSGSRPGSPHVDQENRMLRSGRYPGVNSPKDSSKASYSTHPLSASSNASRYTSTQRTTPSETPLTAQFHMSQSSYPPPSQALHQRNQSVDSATNSAILPPDKALIRVIYDGGNSRVVDIAGCKSAEDIMLKTLRKSQLPEAHVKNYCFYVLDGPDANPALCRRLSETDLVRVCNDTARHERGRLILRKIHAGEPDDVQLKLAASIYTEQSRQANIILPRSEKSQAKIAKLTGESLPALSYPLSPASAEERRQHIHSTARVLDTPARSAHPAVRAANLKQFFGARPPSELIASDLTSYFPNVGKGEIDKTLRMSIRRSQRLSRAASRLSMASNFSVASSLKDAPPLPSIADSWLQGGNQARPLRPLSVMRLGLPSQTGYRDSVTSSVLEPLDEESPLEPSRKSYVSFGGESGSDTLGGTESEVPTAGTTLGSYFDDAGSSLAGSSTGNTENGDSLNRRLSQAIAEDGEESDDELAEYLETDSWENVKYMKGALIGQGSFGSVYLALHAVTGELMAVKQVEVPSPSGTSQMDHRKTNMVEALKHEIGLLRDLKHENIVQYLGSNSDDNHLNIFLEYVPGGSVATMLVNYGPLGESLIQNFVRQILQGLSYLHSRDIIHRDIKGANILVDNKGSVKISDFGISKRVEASTLLSGPGGGKKGAQRVSLQGSVFWMAPEVVRQTAYTRSADIWSLGCLIVEMYTGSHPHPNCTQMQAIFKIGVSGDACPTMPDNAGDNARAFLGQTFLIDHEKRPSADELLASPFITSQSA